jgi:death-on-curing protein
LLAVQERLLADFGGATGIRDTRSLDSALARPQNLFACETPTLFELAASYAFGLINNHLFVDGNKRIGFVAAVVFLEMNGYHFTASEAEAVVQTLALAAGEDSEADYAAWFEQNAEQT